MLKRGILVALVLSGSAMADEKKTVTLDQDEIVAYTDAVEAQTAAQLKIGRAKGVLDKIKAAFASPPPPPPAPPADAPPPK